MRIVSSFHTAYLEYTKEISQMLSATWYHLGNQGRILFVNTILPSYSIEPLEGMEKGWKKAREHFSRREMHG
jgi:hypothetical protein